MWTPILLFACSRDGERPEPCARTAPIELSATASDGRIGTDRLLSVTVSEPAEVAALCTSDADPSEQHLVESSEAATSHELRLQGLLPETTYTCEVAATCPLARGEPVAVPVTTGRRPELPVLSVDVDPDLGMTGYWTLLPYMDGACSDRTRYLLLYDAAGQVRWWYDLPSSMWIDIEALYDPVDHTIVWGGGDAKAGRARVVDVWAGEIYETRFPGSDELVFSHDAKRMPDGQLLTLDYRETTNGTNTWLGFGVTLHDPATGEVSFDRTSQRYFDEGWIPPGSGQPYSDPYHANWLELDGDDLYVSLCEDASLMSFDRESGDVRWKFGEGQGWTLLDEAGGSLPDSELPQCQHGNEVLERDVLLLYDNSYSRPQSRVVRWRLDPDTLTARREWLWTEPNWHEGSLGDVDVLENGRLLVTEAHPECWSESPGDRSAIVEVDPETGAVASRLEFPGVQDTTYRAERYDGCTLFGSLAACPALARRAEELGRRVGW